MPQMLLNNSAIHFSCKLFLFNLCWTRHRLDFCTLVKLFVLWKLL